MDLPAELISCSVRGDELDEYDLKGSGGRGGGWGLCWVVFWIRAKDYNSR